MLYLTRERYNMISNILSCSFTGHRPRSFSFGFDESSPEFAQLRQRIRNTIIQVCNAGCRTFYCGMAEGVDLWCGELVLELRDSFEPPLRIVPVVPFLAQPSSMKEWNQKRYHRIMESAEERYLVSREYTKLCYQKRNHFLVDSADALIAVFKETEYSSGTGQTVRYAKRKKKKIFMINV